ncbi:Uncharacterised protein [Mycobacteroides abscessus subsp. bolletii]|nr:Uncharacterised protein [Mycobacteroides abscessus subsp. bolletii]SHT86793.1 Uncharacterised protein [Mycobacteroides abscessus subsp. bolletii]SHU00420.1 Uncharacterised protein [Mycobacteroides abscessus subsp. bolletii]SKH27026.1 Uncharacterised protein [Mycobacteroides abscessus subsp. bolletii]SKH49923.1 Uncharacterised protein [Mycobacteroides abscessus subsp. bolletii]
MPTYKFLRVAPAPQAHGRLSRLASSVIGAYRLTACMKSTTTVCVAALWFVDVPNPLRHIAFLLEQLR